jgi:hypothetical protein
MGVGVVEEYACPLLDELLLGGVLTDGDDAASSAVMRRQCELFWVEV